MPGPSAAITITSAGVAPKAVCVLPGGTVTFTNSDTVQHDIQSGTTCTELNLGVIAPAGSKSATLPTAAICPFHDAGAPSNTALQGTVAVTTAPATGPGY
jgi:plastocyanin